MNASRTSFVAVACAALSGLALAASGLAFGATDADKNVTVVFVHPENFTDLKDRRFPGEQETNAYLVDLRRYIEQRAGSELGADRKLEVSITDVDMAGQVEPNSFQHHDVRILRNSMPPRIDLAFRITDSSGRVLKSGQRHLSDLAYLSPATRNSNVPMYFEKKLLSDWLSDELRH